MADKIAGKDNPPPFMPQITSTEGAQVEALTRPEIRGKDGGERQQKLNEESGTGELSPEVKQARKKFDAGKMSLEEFHEITRTH